MGLYVLFIEVEKSLSTFIDNFLILNNEHLTAETLYNLTISLIDKHKDKCGYANPNALILYNKMKKWVCLYFAIFESCYSIEAMQKNVMEVSCHYSSVAVGNKLIQSDTLAMALHLHNEVSDVFLIDKQKLLLYNHPNPPEDGIIKMDIEKWLHLFQCDRAVVEEVLNKEYINQAERLKALWALMGFDEAAVLYDIHDYDRLEIYNAEALEGFEVIKVP